MRDPRERAFFPTRPSTTWETFWRKERRSAGVSTTFLFLNADGAVAETSSRNVFWAKGNRLFTPSRDCGLLPGVTREIVLLSAAELGYEASQGDFPPGELLRSDFVFLTSSTAGATYVDRVDDREDASSSRGLRDSQKVPSPQAGMVEICPRPYTIGTRREISCRAT